MSSNACGHWVPLIEGRKPTPFDLIERHPLEHKVKT